MAALRTPGGAFDRKRLNGFLEVRTVKGRDDAAPIFRVVSADGGVPVKNANGVETYEMRYNTFIEIDTVAARVASIQLATDGAPAKAWLDTSSVADAETGDAVVIASAILSAFHWPGLRGEERR